MRRFSEMAPRPRLFKMAGVFVCMSNDGIGFGDSWAAAYATWIGPTLLVRVRDLIE